MNRTEEIIEQAHNLTREGLTAYDITVVFKAARSLHLIHERQCNGYPASEFDQMKRDERKEGYWIQLIKEKLPNRVTIQGDPRGAPVIVNEGGIHEFRVWG